MVRGWVAFPGAALSVVLAVQSAAGGEATKPGLPIGAKTNKFDVHDVTGPSKGKQTCYV